MPKTILAIFLGSVLLGGVFPGAAEAVWRLMVVKTTAHYVKGEILGIFVTQDECEQALARDPILEDDDAKLCIEFHE